MPTPITTNTRFYGDTLDILRAYVADSSVVAELLGWAAARGRLPELRAGRATVNPGNKALQAWLASLRTEPA